MYYSFIVWDPPQRTTYGAVCDPDASFQRTAQMGQVNYQCPRMLRAVRETLYCIRQADVGLAIHACHAGTVAYYTTALEQLLRCMDLDIDVLQLQVNMI
jgi:hypothetical protein